MPRRIESNPISLSNHYPEGIDSLDLIDNFPEVNWKSITDPRDLRDGIWTVFQNILPEGFKRIPQPTATTETPPELENVRSKIQNLIQEINTAMGEYSLEHKQNVNGSIYYDRLHKMPTYDMAYNLEEWICYITDQELTVQKNNIQQFLDSHSKSWLTKMMENSREILQPIVPTSGIFVEVNDLTEDRKQPVRRDIFGRLPPEKRLAIKQVWESLYWDREGFIGSDIRFTAKSLPKITENIFGTNLCSLQVTTDNQKIEDKIAEYFVYNVGPTAGTIYVEGMVSFDHKNRGKHPAIIGTIKYDEDMTLLTKRKKFGVMSVSQCSHRIESEEISSTGMVLPENVEINLQVTQTLEEYLNALLKLDPSIVNILVEVVTGSGDKMKMHQVGITLQGRLAKLLLIGTAEPDTSGWEMAIALQVARETLIQNLPSIFTFVRSEGKRNLYRYSDNILKNCFITRGK